ncbi:hypothetical protein OF83DRAFT_1248003 [Amylostereum chailletii]|nr:hypothetical protein OF83DRAFT_1248003 [Amylostereum chailletii]
MSLKCIGPMPPTAFLANFSAIVGASPPSQSRFKLSTSQAEGHRTLCVENHSFCTHLTFSSSPSGNHTEHACPSRVYAFSKGSKSCSPEDTKASPPVELVIEYTRSDPFRDPNPNLPVDRSRFDFQRASSRALDVLQKHGVVIKDILASHPRVFVFSVLISDEGARLLRWDRSGIIVTERFDHTSDDSPLLEFLRRLDHMSDEDRGHDTSFSFPSNDEAAIARAAFATSVHFPISPEAPLRKVSVRDDHSGENTFYVVSNPQTINDQLFGVNSRGYVATDLRDGSLVWLKDVWRHESSLFFKEGDVYRKLNGKNVPHIPSLRTAGDVGSQVTQCQDFLDAPWNCVETDLPTRRHYRLVLGTIGRPLHSFKSTHELCTSIRDAIEGHAKAYTELGLLHGDISAGNILITDDGGGLLIDWDLAFDVAAGRKGSVIGTWSFISGRLMQKPKEKEHVLHDDLESFFHVFLYHIAHFRPTGCLPSDLDTVYYAGMRDNVPYRTYLGKMSVFCQAVLDTPCFEGYVSAPCSTLIEQIRGIFWRGIYGNTTVTPRSRNAALKALQSSDRMLRLFNTALKKSTWPKDDGNMDAMATFRTTSPGIRQASRTSSGKRSMSTAFGDDSESESLVSVKRRCSLSRSSFTSSSSSSSSNVSS